jgi:hypothetical protein
MIVLLTLLMFVFFIVSLSLEISKINNKHSKLIKNAKVKVISGFHINSEGTIIGYNRKNHTHSGGLFSDALYVSEHWVVKLTTGEEITVRFDEVDPI